MKNFFVLNVFRPLALLRASFYGALVSYFFLFSLLSSASAVRIGDLPFEKHTDDATEFPGQHSVLYSKETERAEKGPTDIGRTAYLGVRNKALRVHPYNQKGLLKYVSGKRRHLPGGGDPFYIQAPSMEVHFFLNCVVRKLFGNSADIVRNHLNRFLIEQGITDTHTLELGFLAQYVETGGNPEDQLLLRPHYKFHPHAKGTGEETVAYNRYVQDKTIGEEGSFATQSSWIFIHGGRAGFEDPNALKIRKKSRESFTTHPDEDDRMVVSGPNEGQLGSKNEFETQDAFCLSLYRDRDGKTRVVGSLFWLLESEVNQTLLNLSSRSHTLCELKSLVDQRFRGEMSRTEALRGFDWRHFLRTSRIPLCQTYYRKAQRTLIPDETQQRVVNEIYLNSNTVYQRGRITTSMKKRLGAFANLPGTPRLLPVGFNWKHYLASYKDLRDAFSHLDQEGQRKAAIVHFFNHGMRERRRISFSPVAYMYSYTDLIHIWAQMTSKEQRSAATDHYLNHGISEGRVADNLPEGFSAFAYLMNHPDLKHTSKSLSMPDKLRYATRHYLTQGVSEERKDYKVVKNLATYTALLNRRKVRTDAAIYRQLMKLTWEEQIYFIAG